MVFGLLQDCIQVSYYGFRQLVVVEVQGGQCQVLLEQVYQVLEFFLEVGLLYFGGRRDFSSCYGGFVVFFSFFQAGFYLSVCIRYWGQVRFSFSIRRFVSLSLLWRSFSLVRVGVFFRVWERFRQIVLVSLQRNSLWLRSIWVCLQVFGYFAVFQLRMLFAFGG